MIKFRGLCLLVLAALVGLCTSAVTIDMYERQAEIQFNQTEMELNAIGVQLLPTLLKRDEDRDMNDNMLLAASYYVFTNKTRELAKRLKPLPYAAFQNEQLKRRIRLISDLGPVALDIGASFEFVKNLEVLKNLSIDRFVCDVEPPNRCNLAYLPHIRGVISNSQDAGLLQRYWIEWRNKVSSTAKAGVRTYVDLYRDMAIANGYNQPSAYYYLGYEDDNILTELTEVMEELRPLYIEFHAHLRHVLKMKHGNMVVSDAGPIPLHLLEQTIFQAWKKYSILEDPFYNKRLPNVKEQLDRQGYTALRILQAGDLFFQSLGMGKLPDEFWADNIRQMTNAEGGPDCKAELFTPPGAVGLLYCPKPNFKKFLQTHGTMSQVRYAYAIKDLPLGFSQHPCPGFDDALGEAAVLSSSTPRHLRDMGLVPHYLYEPEIGLNRLFRMGVHTLFSLPLYFVYEKLTVNLIDGVTNVDELNCAFWELMDKYVGAEPPVERSNQNIDVTYRFYNGLDLEKRHTNKLVSEILGYQFYKSFCLKSEGYRPNNPDYPLDNCDFAGNAEVGRVMMNLMEQGAKKSWRDLIEPIVGTRKLSGRAMREYYEPLRVWLQQENQRNGIRTGWTPTNKCRK